MRRKRKPPSDEAVRRAWDEAEEIYPDKSTEFLLAMVTDMLVIEFGSVEYGDVIDALERTAGSK